MQSSDKVGVAIGGFMGTGKSTIGPLLAKNLGLPFLDCDALLADRFGPIAEQFARDGEPEFRRRERALIEALCEGGAAVIATGGGAWADATVRATLASWGRRVVLTAPIEVIRARLAADRAQPAPARPLAPRLDDLLSARAAAYGDADRIIDTSERTPAEIAAEIAAWVRA